MKPPQPPRAWGSGQPCQSLFFGQARTSVASACISARNLLRLWSCQFLCPSTWHPPKDEICCPPVSSDLRRGPKNNGVLEEQPVTTVTSSQPRSVERCLGGRYGSTDGFPVAAEAGRSSRGLPAPCEDAAICAWCRLPWALGRPHRSDCSEGTPMLTVAPHSTAVRLV